jgi:arylsulfatase A-like enzyme
MKQARWLAVAALTATCGCRACGSAPPSPPPRGGSGLSILLITIDTLRADHLGVYNYRRATSPRIDDLAARGAVFGRAYTYWPKTRASMVAMLTGLYASRNGYDQAHRVLHESNPTLASTLRASGYATWAVVDNANLARTLGFGKGFDSFEEMWARKDVKDEAAGARAISDSAVGLLNAAPKDRPFFLWLHYVNPHAPYTPPPPHDSRFDDALAAGGPALKTVVGFRGGVSRRLAVPGHDRLGYYVARYDGEIAFADAEVGRVLDALAANERGKETAILLTSDHGESLGEHDYYFDHGEDLFDPCLRVPLIVVAPGGRARVRSDVLASTLDVMPTILDLAKVRYPPDLAGLSLLPVVQGQPAPARDRLFAENDRGLVGTHDARMKLVAEPVKGQAARLALYDLANDAAETRDVSRARARALQTQRAVLEGFMAERGEEWAATRQRLAGGPATSEGLPSCDACLRLLQLGYVDSCPRDCQAAAGSR